MTQRLNLEEIGRRAGVSRSTVSRVVNAETNVSDDARRRVEAVIAETGYRPHAAARSLASNRTGVIGLLTAGATTLFDDPYFGRLILGITGATNAMDQTLALFLFDDTADGDPVITRVANSGTVDGVIVTATRMGDPFIDRLTRANIPFVVVGRPDESAATFSVDADNRGGARSAVLHLAALGRRRIAMVAPPQNSTAGIDRRVGFVEGLEEAGLSTDATMIHEGDWTEESGHRAMTRLLGAQPDAVFVGSDRMAVGALRAIADAGLGCPEDLAVVSFDGLLGPDRTDPSLTSVSQPVSEIGARAARLLRQVIDGETTTPEHVTFPTNLVIRESCGSNRN